LSRPADLDSFLALALTLLEEASSFHSINEASSEMKLIRPLFKLLGWADYLPQQGSDHNDGSLRFSIFRFGRWCGGIVSRIFALAIAAVLFVAADPVEGADGGGEGELSGQDGAGDYFGEFFDFSSAAAAQQL